MSPSDQRKHERTPVALLVQYRFNSFEEFLAEYAVDLSPGGMFVRTDEPREVGTLLSLQFTLKDGSKLIEGVARVVRVIPPGPEVERPGMALEFVDFDPESRRLVEQICNSPKRPPRR